MAKTDEIKIPEDIEFHVIGNSLGFLFSSAGLLAGEMVRFRNFDYWTSDIVPLLLLTWTGFRLYKSFLSMMIAYYDSPPIHHHSAPATTHIPSEQVVVGQITSKPSYSADKVLQEVTKRIESQKADAHKRNKFTS